ncbi:unnamed protein product, partial [Brassica rapa]
THRTSVGVRQHTHDTSVGVRQHTQDVRGCPCVSHTHDVRVCPSAHTGRLWLSICTHISTLVLGLSTLALPVDCLGDFVPRGLSVQYTQDDVRGCPSAHTLRPCVSVSTHRMSVAVHVCLCVSVSTHRTSVAVHQYTYQHVGPWTQPADPPRGLFVTHRTSVGVRQHTQDVRGCLWLSVNTHRTSVAHTHDVRGCLCVRVSVCVRQHTQDVRGCPSVHISARWSLDSARWPFPWTVWVCLFSTHRTSYTQDVHGCPPAHTGRPWLSVSVHQHTQDVCGCQCVSFSTHRMSVGVRQHTQDVPVCPSSHTGRPWLSVCVHVCPSPHTGSLWLSISTHISTLVLGLST